jgi:hypothetical protein
LLKIYDYKKIERKQLAGKLQGKTVTILDSTKISEVKKMQKSLEEKFYVLDSNIQELKTLNMGMEKKMLDLQQKQKDKSTDFDPIWNPLVPKDSTGMVDISQNMSIYGTFGSAITEVDPARIMMGSIIGGEFNFEEKLHALLEFQIFWQADRKINVLGGIKYDLYDRANIILSGVLKAGYSNMKADASDATQDAFIFQFGFAPEIRLTNDFSLYMQLLYSGCVVESSVDDDVITVIGLKYYF